MWKECSVCDTYLISSDGEVKNKYTGKILKQKLDRNNHLLVHLSLGDRNTTKYFSVHRLVAEAYVPNPENLEFVKHKDGNYINNEFTNLEWTNGNDAVMPKGDNAYYAKLTNDQAKWCRKVYIPRDPCWGCGALAKRFNVSKSTMSYILNNITYK